jgi:hypothetical protein
MTTGDGIYAIVSKEDTVIQHFAAVPWGVSIAL